MMDLVGGETVKLGAHHLTGQITLSLTTGQMKKIDAAMKANRGTTLKFSAAQIRHHAKQGEGIMQDLANAGLAMLKPIARKGISAGLNFGKDFIQDKAENALGLKDKQGKGFLGDLFKSIGLGANQTALHRPRLINKVGPIGDMTLGHAVARGRGKKGKGFLSKLLRRGAHGLVDVIGDTLGGGAINPLANANEQLAAALSQKKVAVAVPGAGLYLPGR